jgi:hypothetical protein
MANQISGRVIAVSKVQTVASADPNKASLKKREIYIDCTRYDPYTGERSQYENKPLLEFVSDKTLEKVNPVLDSIQKDDIVTISFDLQGRQYKGQDGKTKFSTGIRCYDIVVTRRAGQGGAQTAAPQPQYFDNHQPQQQQAPMGQSPFVAEQQAQVSGEKKDDLPF